MNMKNIHDIKSFHTIMEKCSTKIDSQKDITSAIKITCYLLHYICFLQRDRKSQHYEDYAYQCLKKMHDLFPHFKPLYPISLKSGYCFFCYTLYCISSIFSIGHKMEERIRNWIDDRWIQYVPIATFSKTLHPINEFGLLNGLSGLLVYKHLCPEDTFDISVIEDEILSRISETEFYGFNVPGWFYQPSHLDNHEACYDNSLDNGIVGILLALSLSERETTLGQVKKYAEIMERFIISTKSQIAYIQNINVVEYLDEKNLSEKHINLNAALEYEIFDYLLTKKNHRKSFQSHFTHNAGVNKSTMSRFDVFAKKRLIDRGEVELIPPNQTNEVTFHDMFFQSLDITNDKEFLFLLCHL